MAKRKSQDEGSSESSWMNTYADMVTLLLTFFIMLFSMSSVQEEKWQMLIKAFTNQGDETSQIVVAPIGDGEAMAANHGMSPLPLQGENVESTNEMPESFDELYEYLQQYVEANDMQASVEISKGEGSVYIRFQDNIFFDPDSYVLKAVNTKLLDFIGDGLKSVEDQILLININGHTAAIPNYEDYPVNDWRLSGERAASVAIFFEELKGIDPQKIIQIGYGKSRPVEENTTPEGREQNRRVDMMIVSNQDTVEAEQLLTQLLSGTFNEGDYPKSGNIEDALLPKEEGETPPETPEPATPEATPPVTVPESTPQTDTASAAIYPAT